MNSRNVLFFIHSLTGGGAERVTANLANWWAQQSWDVTVVTIASAEEDFYVLDPRVRRVTLSLASHGKGLFRSLGNNLRRVTALRKTLVKVNPQFVIAMMTTSNVLLGFAARRLSTCAVGSERIYPPWQSLGRVRELMRRYVYGFLDVIVTGSEESARWLKTHTRAPRVEVIPNAVLWPLPRQHPVVDPQSVCRSGRRIVIGVGRLNQQKQFECLVEAFSGLAEKYPAWDLVILGEGPERSNLQTIIRRKSLADRVHLPGKVGNVDEWYKRADLFALTSASEGFPNALAEAMAYGLPVVSFDCKTGPRDIIRHGVDGLLVKANDIAALATSMGELLGNEARREAMGRRATEVRQQFSMERIAGLWESLFDELDSARLRANRQA
jgi:glycosyltransferase involved in cell wall biosynthesis